MPFFGGVLPLKIEHNALQANFGGLNFLSFNCDTASLRVVVDLRSIKFIYFLARLTGLNSENLRPNLVCML